MISGRTRVFAVLGSPVAHSLSPVMQNAAFRALGLDAVYVALACRPDAVAEMVSVLAAAGGGGNLTVPHKERVVETVTPCSDRVSALGACNTFWGDGETIWGDNTDVAGITAELARLNAPATVWLVAGAGGAARAVAEAARMNGAALAVVSRPGPRSDRFLAWLDQEGIATAPAAEAEVLINATPLGLQPTDPMPLPPRTAPRARTALDLVYARGETAWVRALRAQGFRAADGRGLLVEQGAAALERWFTGTAAPREIMRAAVRAALR